jgi:hypothetical protein
MTKPRIHFTALNKTETKSRIKSAVDNSIEFIVWVKGRSIKNIYRPLQANFELNEIKMKELTEASLLKQEILFKFEIGGSHYFGQGKITKNAKNELWLKYNDELFKSERRDSFRLLTYPTYDVKIVFRVKDAYQGSNVIDFKQGASQTNIFRNFLKLIGQNDEEANSKIEMRVLDLSVTGLSFIIGEIEQNLFHNDDLLVNFQMSFAGDVFDIPRARVVYVINYIQQEKKALKQFKVGIKFEQMSLAADGLLGKKINQILRENESNDEFEDFVR